MKLIPKTDQRWNGGPGTWFPVTLPDGRRSAMLNCPGCPCTGSLSNHEVAVDGTVSPSVLLTCQHGTFHDFIRLENWELPA